MIDEVIRRIENNNSVDDQRDEDNIFTSFDSKKHNNQLLRNSTMVIKSDPIDQD